MMKDKIQSLYTSNSNKNINLKVTQAYPVRDHDWVSQATCITEVAGGHQPYLLYGARRGKSTHPTTRPKTDAITERHHLTTTLRSVAIVEQASRPASLPASQS